MALQLSYIHEAQVHRRTSHFDDPGALPVICLPGSTPLALRTLWLQTRSRIFNTASHHLSWLHLTISQAGSSTKPFRVVRSLSLQQGADQVDRPTSDCLVHCVMDSIGAIIVLLFTCSPTLCWHSTWALELSSRSLSRLCCPACVLLLGRKRASRRLLACRSL